MEFWRAGSEVKFVGSLGLDWLWLGGVNPYCIPWQCVPTFSHWAWDRNMLQANMRHHWGQLSSWQVPGRCESFQSSWRRCPCRMLYISCDMLGCQVRSWHTSPISWRHRVELQRRPTSNTQKVNTYVRWRLISVVFDSSTRWDFLSRRIYFQLHGMGTWEKFKALIWHGCVFLENHLTTCWLHC